MTSFVDWLRARLAWTGHTNEAFKRDEPAVYMCDTCGFRSYFSVHPHGTPERVCPGRLWVL